MQRAKEQLIESLRKKDIPEYIISAFEKVPREKFVPEHLQLYSYDDLALPIESGSTISQPSTVAFILSLLEPKQHQKILEIGSGSGYLLALISEIIKDGKIYGLELNKRLAVKSRQILEKDSNIEIFHKSGHSGLPTESPFDRIVISASSPNLDFLYLLTEQLDDPGIIVAPVGSSIFQIKKQSGIITKKEFQGFSFVPMREEE